MQQNRRKTSTVWACASLLSASIPLEGANAKFASYPSSGPPTSSAFSDKVLAECKPDSRIAIMNQLGRFRWFGAFNGTYTIVQVRNLDPCGYLYAASDSPAISLGMPPYVPMLLEEVICKCYNGHEQVVATGTGGPVFAARYGHLEVLRWACEHGECPPTIALHSYKCPLQRIRMGNEISWRHKVK